MAKKPQQSLSYSVLDRLLSAEFDNTVTAVSGEPNELFVKRLINTIARDLQNLLNTRKILMQIPEEYKDLSPSIMDYGVIDLTTLTANSGKDREAFRASIKRAIELYEPRLKKINVDVADNPNDDGLIFHFNIKATLLIEPTPLILQFDTVLPSSTRTFEVQGLNYAG